MCNKCNNTGWVCEDHTDKPWGEEEGECECGAGKNCDCNSNGDVEWEAVYATVEPEKVKVWAH